jgi:hypothetical protein
MIASTFAVAFYTETECLLASERVFLWRVGATHQLLHGIAQAPLKIFEMRVVEGVHAVGCSLGPICFRSSDCIFWPWRGLGLSLRVAVDRSSCHYGDAWFDSWLMWEL